ncbi:hypothetical protein SAMN05660662_0370 [Blastococcus aurantiacus]|uniref:Uncharacterized protein n=1 Tax=Blastococcus aurantiacus TaxID=1550231 RepID=A0A1G7RLD9_9ACTN|nr:hypothetical protein [Blastococcus aurantiacus]SDG11616.1 hypothetical protein SAMN05660662_0370 [Blastococcus aurantiacus]
MTARRGAVLAVVALIPLAGCVRPEVLDSEVVACREGDEGTPANGVVLLAQSVPTATWVPCLEAIPLGWNVSGLESTAEDARFWLDSDRDGVRAVEIRLDASCDTTGATRIPSDRDAMQRWERVTQVTPEFVGTRHYVFEGGCISVLFRLSGENRAEPLGFATQGIGTVARDAVRAAVREQTDGRLELDPADGDR